MGIFDEVYDRRNTRSMKWDAIESVFSSNEVLPMWVADMDFKPPQAVNDAIIKRAEHGIYGYTFIDEDVKNTIVNWQKERHHWDIKQDWLSFTPSVVFSLHMAVQALTDPDDKILIQTPVYTPFYSVIEEHGREVVKNPLVYEDKYYTIDFDDFEEKLKSGVKAFILCSPHNPVGRVWKKDELEEMARLCLKYDVLIISDEIHSDLLFPGQTHIPMASLSEEISEQTVTCMAPSKTFNLAGLQVSYIITQNTDKRQKIENMMSKQGINGLNTMANTALEAAYTHGASWVDELREVLKGNLDYVTEMLETHTDTLKVIRSEGTYLVWIDCSALGMSSKDLNQFMIHEAKIGLNAGVNYGEEGDQFMRMNIACPKSTVEEGVNRIIQAVQSL